MKKLVENLVKLQEFDTRLRELKLQKGDLPMLVENLDVDLTEKRETIAGIQDKISKLQSDRKLYLNENEAGKAQLKKYEDQLYKVQNNKEYDAISLEIDTKKAEVDSLENKILQTIEEEDQLKSNSVELLDSISTLEAQLQEVRKELDEIDQVTREEENLLSSKRTKVAGNLESRQLRQYERISNAKSGIAVASIVRNSCGGCFSSIPPQRIVEIRNADRLINCEHCGRILVWVEETEAAIAE